MSDERIKLGDPVPWFEARTLAGASVSISATAGRWIALCFLGDFKDQAVVYQLTQMLAEASLFQDDHMRFYGILTEQPTEAAELAAASHPALGFMMDYDGAISRLFGADASPRLIILDPWLRAMTNFLLGADGTAPDIFRAYLRGLPKPEDAAGVPLIPPVLIVPRIFEDNVCDFLIDLYDKNGGTESGFMIDEGGKTRTVVEHYMKSRKDYVIHDPQVRELIRDRVVRRLVPAMERYFQYRPTRMDRRIVSCYDTESGGHFRRHRDNINAGARHRRFAVSINLNDDFDGCDLIFPEFGRGKYKPPRGGGIVFSTSILHEVTQITRGKRYAYIPFLYGEDEVKMRLANNANLQAGEYQYTGDDDRLFPNG